MDIKGFKSRDGVVHKYDYNALVNVPEGGSTPSGGKDGGYYTPAVTQPNRETIQFAFTPSKADMPNVNPVTVSLPNPGGNGADAILPLVGSTDEITPTQVYLALVEGRQVILQLTAEDKSFLFTSFNLAGSSDAYSSMVFSTIVGLTGDVNRPQCDVIMLVGSTEGKTWSVMHQQLPVMADVPTDEYIKGLIEAELKNHPGSGGNVDYVGVEPAEDDMPKVFLTGSEFGNMTTAKNEVKMGLEYISKTDKFKAAIKIKFQGNTSLTFPKKNFTIKMYTDDTYEDKLKKSFKNWNHSGNKYVLKANWIDHAHARNIISARLWGEVVASRPDYDSLPVEMRNAPNNGAIDGFPVKLYVNGNYEGVYTWNVGKDDWMWGMDEDNSNHVLMCAETNNDGATTNTPCNFRALWSGTDENNWTVEVGTNSTAVKTALNNLIQFVMDNDGDAFRNGINNYLDIQSAIDYYIFQYEICGLDGLAKNMLLATYDGTRWICGAYDMDATFGLYWNGSKFVSVQYRCPEDYQETYSLLWERIEANFAPELKARQAELRKTVLSYSNIVTHFERFMDIIGLDLYAEDLTIYTGIPSGSTNNIKQIRNYIRDRQAYVDTEFTAMSTPIPCAGISLNTNTLTFTAEGSQTLTAIVTPDGCTDPVTWESNNTSVATVDGGIVTAVANGSATITAQCGEHSASCTVTVSGIEVKPDEPDEPETALLYSLPNEIELDGTNAIDTGVKLFENDIDYTIEFDVTPGTQINSGLMYVFSCAVEASPYPGITFRLSTNHGKYQLATGTVSNGFDIPANTTERLKGVLMHKAGCGVSMIIKTESGDSYAVSQDNARYSGVSKTMMIGCGYDASDNYWRHWVGTVHAFKIYDGVVTTGANLIADAEWSDSASYKFDASGNVVSGGTNYVMTNTAEVTGGKRLVVINVADGSYTYLGFAEYDENMTFIKRNEGGNVTVPYTAVTQSNTKYVRASAYPHNVSTNNSPATQIAMF